MSVLHGDGRCLSIDKSHNPDALSPDVTMLGDDRLLETSHWTCVFLVSCKPVCPSVRVGVGERPADTLATEAFARCAHARFPRSRGCPPCVQAPVSRGGRTCGVRSLDSSIPSPLGCPSVNCRFPRANPGCTCRAPSCAACGEPPVRHARGERGYGRLGPQDATARSSALCLPCVLGTLAQRHWAGSAAERQLPEIPYLPPKGFLRSVFLKAPQRYSE